MFPFGFVVSGPDCAGSLGSDKHCSGEDEWAVDDVALDFSVSGEVAFHGERVLEKKLKKATINFLRSF